MEKKNKPTSSEFRTQPEKAVLWINKWEISWTKSIVWKINDKL